MALSREARPAKPDHLLTANAIVEWPSRPHRSPLSEVWSWPLLFWTHVPGEERSTARAPTAYKKPAIERVRREILHALDRALDRSLSARDH